MIGKVVWLGEREGVGRGVIDALRKVGSVGFGDEDDGWGRGGGEYLWCVEGRGMVW